jgi:hypothetical protein
MLIRNAEVPERLKHPRVALMILNFNGLNWLKICLPSVIKSTYHNLDLFLIDNGSVDDPTTFVRSNYPQIKILRLTDNLGFAEAYNRLIKNVESDFVLLLNNDTVVLNPNWVEVLLKRAQRDKSIAAVGCKLVSMNDSSRLVSVGVMGIPYWRGFTDMGLGEYDRGQYDGEDFEPFAVCAGAVLINREAFMRAGGFDGKFFLYVEDVDLSWRLRLLGYRVGFEANARIAHHFSSAGDQILNLNTLFYSHRNLLRAILKNCGPSLGWALRNYFLYSLLLALGFSIYEPKKALAIVKGIVWNLINLRDTYTSRLDVQSKRNTAEHEILGKMYPRAERYQPHNHIKLRGILDLLFERGQYPQVRRFEAGMKVTLVS